MKDLSGLAGRVLELRDLMLESVLNTDRLMTLMMEMPVSGSI